MINRRLFQTDAFTGFGWFAPNDTHTLDTLESTFIRRTAAGETQVYLYCTYIVS
jgi:hypothetical protein